MKILHVTIGNPFMRSGGLNRYCMDLVNSQIAGGHEVDVLYPGTFLNSRNPIIIKKGKGIFEIFDALPSAITYGVENPNAYMVPSNIKTYISFLKKNQPDVVHVHSIQGIHREFFLAVKRQGIPMLFTTHDYYPICLRCVMLDANGMLCTKPSAEACRFCNNGYGLSITKQRIIQSGIYQSVKNSSFVKKLKSSIDDHKDKSQEESDREVNDYSICRKLSKASTEDYEILLQYYNDIMNQMNIIHCNSSVAESQYKRAFPDIPCITIPIIHGDLQRSRHSKRNVDVLNISYMGGMSRHKGYYIVIDAVKKLEERRIDGWKLFLYGSEFTPEYESEKIHYNGFFTHKNEKAVWDNTDLLVVCSQWMETFGFIVIEALCHGIPVLCSDLVGSKDLVSDICQSLIFKHDDTDELSRKIEMFLDEDYYSEVQEKVNGANIEVDMNEHSRHMVALYDSLIEPILS